MATVTNNMFGVTDSPCVLLRENSFQNSLSFYDWNLSKVGERLFQELEKRHLEGMVAKRVDNLYVGGRTRTWLKIKTKAGREEMRTRSETWGHPTS